MRILIDINHPAHVHYFKNLIINLKENDHDVTIVARDREFVKELLESLNFPFINRGKGKKSILGKLIYMIKADFQYLRIALKIRPDLFLSFSTPYVHQIAYLLGKPSIALNDTEHTDRAHSKLTYPFCSSIITPSNYQNMLGSKQIRINSVIENLYLHRNYFEPDYKAIEELGIKLDEEFVLLRFVSWNAHHDVGQSGLDIQAKRNLINILKKKYRIFISSEEDLNEEFKQFQINISPEKMHHVLSYASMFIGESGTMASESAVLGTPAVYINSLPLMCYLKLEKEEGLLEHFTSSNGVVEYVTILMQNPNLKSEAKAKCESMKKKFIDPTQFLTWFIEEYPKSAQIIKEEPEYQLKFK